MNEFIDQNKLSNEVNELKDEEANNLIESILDFASGETHGQLRKDCKWRKFDLAGIQLGFSEVDLPDKEKKRLMGKVVNEIHLGEQQKNVTYLVSGLYSVEFLKEVFGSVNETVYFLPSYSYNRFLVYQGPIQTIFSILNSSWLKIYEFYLVNKTYEWLVTYDHHHHLYLLGDAIANRSNYLSKRRKWVERILDFSFHPKDT